MTRRAAWLVLLVAATALSIPRSAGAFEFFDGRLQIHGFGEAIIRTLNNNFEYDYDLSQMQFVLNLEAELDIAPDGFGPFSAMSAYARVEVRYDCVWRKACYLAPNSVDHLGDRIRALPNWRTDGRESRFTGTTFGDPTAAKYHGGSGSHRSRAVTTVMDSLFKGAYENRGPDLILGTKDDPAPLVAGKYGEYKISANKVRGPLNGEGIAWEIPWRPEDQLPEGPGLFRFTPNAVSPLEPGESCQISVVQSDSCKLGWQKVSTLVAGSTASGRTIFTGGLAAPPPPPNTPTFTPQGAGWPEPMGIPFGAQPRDIALNIEALKYYRPWPLTPVREAGDLSKTEASGLYFPSAAFRNYLRTDDQSSFDQNFSQSQLEWNHGASQSDERELKEAYLDIEMADGALWLRIGKQNIVWAKTDVFRVADKINPQDLGLASLPSLEESRIALWAVRAVYSFYDVGPLQDVRLELAALIDEFEPADVGRCGEPYSPRPVFGKCLGIFAHSATGLGLAGETQPMNWWDSAKGMEFGGRLEWRWKRFSFALMDYYGFDDFARIDVINKYSRNVDPYTGRPRWGMTTERCDPQRGGQTKGCLGTVITSPYPAAEMAGFVPNGAGLIDANPSSTWGRGGFAPPGDGPGRKSEVQNTRILEARKRASQDSNLRDILENHPANQSFYHFACASSIGFTDLAPTECGFNIFGSGQVLTTGFGGAFEEIPISAGLALLFGGSTTLFDLAIGFLNPAAAGVLNVVPLNHNDMAPGRCRLGQDCKSATTWYSTEWDPRSRTGEGAFGLWGDQPYPLPVDPYIGERPPGGQLGFIFQRLGTISTAFTPEQQALMGCGAYYASSCDRQGLDLLNAEASALFQAWPGFDGTPIANYRMDDKNKPAPGTVAFKGGPVCTRYERGKQFILPGCRGPEDPGYQRNVDGHPYFNELLNNSSGSLPAGTSPPASDLVNFDSFATKNGCKATLNSAGRLRDDNVRLFNPINCQPFRSEMAAFSYNFLAVAILFSTDSKDDGFSDPEDFDEFDATRPYDPNRCSLAAPQFCSVVRSLLSVTGVGRNTVKAGGNFSYGRRDFLWHGGQEVVLRYDRQNTLSFQMDFAEDWSKTNWGMEFTWIDSLPLTDANADSTVTNTDQYTLVVSVDRPTFINFLNANRTFLFNSQWFMSYRPDHGSGFQSNGPYNVTTTFTILTGYFQDRLLGVFTLVYDFQSESGGGLPSLTYRFSESFSATFGMAFFWGRSQSFDMLSMPRALGNRVGTNAYQDHVETGLGVVRDRDEFFFRLRYSF